MMGTGSMFAFPGSMIGAFLAAYLYQKSKKLMFAFTGEIVGTGILGAIVCYPIATLVLGQEVALFGFIPAFLTSSIAGALLGLILLSVVLKNSAFKTFQHNNYFDK
jgi:energy coupling factor transporter S component ThiW